MYVGLLVVLALGVYGIWRYGNKPKVKAPPKTPV